MRETVGIVLGERCDVRSGTPEDYLRDPSAYANADVLIAGDNIPLEVLAAIPRGTRFLWLQDGTAPLPPTHGASARLPRAFRPTELRRQVEQLLEARRPTSAGANLWTGIDYPVLPVEAIA